MNIKSNEKPLNDEQLKFLAKAIALAVRNQMEDFHVKYLSDAQMEELNPIIRNSIYSFMKLQMENNVELLKIHYDMIPDYWEDPVLVKL